MKTLTSKDAKCGFGRHIYLARVAAVTKHGRLGVVVMTVDEYERLKALDAPATVQAATRKAKQ